MFAVLTTARKVPGFLAVLFSILWLAACQPVSMSGGGGGGGQPGGSGAAVPVALLVPHGSAVPQEQKLARDLENAARLAAADLNGVKIDLRVYGTAGNAAQAQTAAMNAVADGARIIIGPLHAESANAVAVAVANDNVNVLAFSNNPTIAGGNLYILGQTFQTTADRLASFATRQGKSRILTVYSDNLSGRMGKQAIERAIAQNGATPAGSVGYEFSQHPPDQDRRSAKQCRRDLPDGEHCRRTALVFANAARSGPEPCQHTVHGPQPLGHAAANAAIARRSGRLVHPARPATCSTVPQPVPGGIWRGAPCAGRIGL